MNLVNGNSGNDAANVKKDSQIEGGDDAYGFDKTLVLLTRPNKIVAISSLDGEVLWSRLIKDPIRRMMLEQGQGNAALEIITSKGHMIEIDPLNGAIRKAEPLPTLPQAVEDTEFIVAQGHSKEDSRIEKQALIAVPKNGEGPIVNLKPDKI